MNKRELVSHKKIQSPTGKPFEVGYYITMESGRLNDFSPGYGIIIEKCDQGDIEVYEATGCFYEYAPAFAMAEKLSRYSVTPSGAEETIESILEYINR